MFRIGSRKNLEPGPQRARPYVPNARPALASGPRGALSSGELLGVPRDTVIHAIESRLMRSVGRSEPFQSEPFPRLGRCGRTGRTRGTATPTAIQGRKPGQRRYSHTIECDRNHIGTKTCWETIRPRRQRVARGFSSLAHPMSSRAAARVHQPALPPHGRMGDGAVLQVRPTAPPPPPNLSSLLSLVSSLGRRPCVSWLVETSDRDSTPLAKADPTDLASIGESDLWLLRGPAARGPPLPQNDIR